MALEQITTSKSFYQREEVGPLPAKQFFLQKDLQVQGAQDDHPRRQEYDTEEFIEWYRRQTPWIARLIARINDKDDDVIEAWDQAASDVTQGLVGPEDQDE